MNMCCDILQQILKDEEVHITYDQVSRSYGIGIRGLDNGVMSINFCPWCGKKLPRDLGNELSKIVFEELKLDGYDDPYLPDEFQTDEWWKKRGL